MHTPLVSVVIPTYKRHDLLPRAVDSALGQTYTNIEVVVSDDEDPPGPSWTYLQRRTAEDPRLRPTRNPGRHGEAWNMNNALAQARGEWIKPLHDDDVLLPECVERFMAYCRGRDHIALASCLSASISNGQRRDARVDQNAPRAELIRQKYVHLGMYLMDLVTGGPPTTIFINRRAVEAGGRMVEDPDYRYFSDARWKTEIVRHGDSALIHELLVEYHQGEHESLSSEFRGKPELLDAEALKLREVMFAAIPPEMNPPPLETARQMVHVMRALSDLKARRVGRAVQGALRAWRPRAWMIAMRVSLHQLTGGTRFKLVPREPLPPVTEG